MVPNFRSLKSLALGCALAGMTCGIGAAQEPPNGDFEDGLLDPWSGDGDVGVSQVNVLEGHFSAFLTTGVNAVGEVCSNLESPFVFPPTDRARARVAFMVRYKTDEGTGPYTFFEDPFHAEFVTAHGAVDLVTIKTDTTFFTRGDPTQTRVENAGGLPPRIPPFEAGDVFVFETPSLRVRSEIHLRGCEPVRVKFQICDWGDTIVDSAAFLDRVRISFLDGGHHCTDTSINPDIMDGVEEFPAPREP